jgi:hypothetical protein
MKKYPQALHDDSPMWDIWMSMYQMSTITVADEIGLFKLLSHSPLSISMIASNLNINPNGTEALIEVLTELQFLGREKRLICLTSTSKSYLLESSMFYWGDQLLSLRDKDEHKRLLAALKQSFTQLTYHNMNFTDMWKEGTLTKDAAQYFTKGMQATILAPAVNAVDSGVFASTKKLLDMGGGSGCFSIAYIKKYPKFESAIFELPVVCDITSEYLLNAGLIQKIGTIKGNFFKDKWPEEFDGILFSQIFHDWPLIQCKYLADQAYQVLPKDGKIYIHEMLLDSGRKSNLTTACFNLLMFINHQSQQFSKEKLFDLLVSVGFKNPKVKKTFGYFSIVSATK